MTAASIREMTAMMKIGLLSIFFIYAFAARESLLFTEYFVTISVSPTAFPFTATVSLPTHVPFSAGSLSLVLNPFAPHPLDIPSIFPTAARVSAIIINSTTEIAAA